MEAAAARAILPTLASSLFISYSTNRPEFVASTFKLHSHYYYIFGTAVTLYLFVLYLLKGVVVDPAGQDKGEVMAHVFLLKTAVLSVYPSYAEMANYCSGFMTADLPWLNSYFGRILSEPTDASPYPYLLFYSSLSIGSTYFLPLVLIFALALILLLLVWLRQPWRPSLRNIALFLYSFFLAGVAFSGVASVQGALLNPVEEYTRKSNLYIIGIIIFILLTLEALQSVYYRSGEMWKLRVLAKAALLSILHFNPLYLFPTVAGS